MRMDVRRKNTCRTICEKKGEKTKRGKRGKVWAEKKGKRGGGGGGGYKEGRTEVTIGVLGGGQLGQMLTAAAARMGVKVTCLDASAPKGSAPASRAGAEHIVGAPLGVKARADVLALAARGIDALTVEVEHVDAEALREAGERYAPLRVFPSGAALALVQDKYAQKVHMQSVARVPVMPFMRLSGGKKNGETVDDAVKKFGTPLLIKRRRLAYDGRGNVTLRDRGCGAGQRKESKDAVERLGGYGDDGAALYAEKFVDFDKELAVMVVRGDDGSMRVYPVAETVHKDHMCDTVVAPAHVDDAVAREAQRIAMRAVESLEGGVGVFGVEMFLLRTPDTQAADAANNNSSSSSGSSSGGATAEWSGRVVLNEIAPRPHNSGHYTIEACECSQFENHLRAVLGWPLGDASMIGGCHAQMVNVVGRDSGTRGEEMAEAEASTVVRSGKARLHMYGKAARAKRKLGHWTVMGASREEVDAIVRTLRAEIDDAVRAAAEKVDRGQEAARALAGGKGGGQSRAAVVGIIMGSDSDMPTMQPAADLLQDEFGITVEMTIVSAHRTPERLFEYARAAAGRGLRVIIAGAGGAAHLPGMVASLTTLPVVGVPVVPTASTLGGMDALLSIVQMPRGVPVATVAIGNAANGALLAARIIGAGEGDAAESVRLKLEEYQTNMRETVMDKIRRLESSPSLMDS